MANKSMSDLDQELFSELTEPLVQPLLIHMVVPFVEGSDPNFPCKSTRISYRNDGNKKEA